MQKNKLNKKISFFKGIPTFSELSKDTIAKFTYFFQEGSAIRNSYLFKQGDKLEYIYIVINGEFEISTKFEYSPDSLSQHQTSEYLKSSIYRFEESKRDTIKEKYINEMNYLVSK